MVWFKKLISKYRVTTVLRWVYCFAALIMFPFGGYDIVHTDYAAMDTHIVLAALFVLTVPTYLPNLMWRWGWTACTAILSWRHCSSSSAWHS